MVGADAKRSRKLRIGCGVLVGIVVILLAASGVLVGSALLQTRSGSVSTHRAEPDLPASTAPGPNDGGAVPTVVRVEVDVSVAQLIVIPARPGEPLQAEAEYDDRRYELEQNTVGDAASGWTYRVRFGPRGSPMWELFKVKIGGPLSRLRLTLPRGMPLELSGEIDSSFATLELGGLWVDTAELNVNQGVVNISFWEPLSHPMDRISVTGNKGAIEVSGLGNASPRLALFDQKLGPMDLDFRGAWSRDADIRIKGRISGGTVWLPDNVTIEGIDRSRAPMSLSRPEIPFPTLRLDISAQATTLVFIE